MLSSPDWKILMGCLRGPWLGLFVGCHLGLFSRMMASDNSRLESTGDSSETLDLANSAEPTKLLNTNSLNRKHSEKEVEEVPRTDCLQATALGITQDSWMPPVDHKTECLQATALGMTQDCWLPRFILGASENSRLESTGDSSKTLTLLTLRNLLN